MNDIEFAYMKAAFETTITEIMAKSKYRFKVLVKRL
jgi:hypothetical protein